LGDLRPAAATVDAYVDAGGTVLSTGSTGLDAGGRPRLATAPTRPGGSPPDRDDALLSSYARSPDGLLMLHGALHREVAVADAVVPWTHVPPAPFGPPEKAYGHEDAGAPVLARIRAGLGHHLRASWTVGRTYLDVGTTDVRDALLRALAPVLAPADVVVDEGPEQIEVIHGTSEGDDVLHLVNLSGVRRNSVGPALPINGIRVRVTGRGPVHARALVADADCPV